MISLISIMVDAVILEEAILRAVRSGRINVIISGSFLTFTGSVGARSVGE